MPQIKRITHGIYVYHVPNRGVCQMARGMGGEDRSRDGATQGFDWPLSMNPAGSSMMNLPWAGPIQRARQQGRTRGQLCAKKQQSTFTA